jgi:hypothetical protein
VQSAVTTATITGNFDFTTPQGVTYHVLNATITEPGYGPNGSGGAITYEPGFSRSPRARGQGHPAQTTRPPQAQGQINTETRVRLLVSARSNAHGRRGTWPLHPRRAKPPAGTAPRCLRYHHRHGKVPTCMHWLTSDRDGAVPIDAKTDPTAAGPAMVQFPTATGKTFTPTDNPLYSNTDQSIISGYWQTPSDQHNPSSGTITIDHQEASSWSIGGSVGAEFGLNVLGFANASVSATFTDNHEWLTSHDDSQAVTANVDPGYVAWIEGYTRQVTFTGNTRSPPPTAPPT